MAITTKEQLIKDLKNPRAIIPNLLSASRMFAPLVIPPLALSGNIPLTLIATAAFLSTDFLDGKIARTLNGQTKLGQLLDQISDKICSIGLLLALVPSIPLMIVPLILESTIALININASTKEHKGDGKSTQNGRLKMWPLSVSLISGYGMLLSPSIIFKAITYLGILTTAALEVVNIKEYYELSKPKDNEEKEERIKPITNTQNQKSKTSEKQKAIAYTEITEYIEQCPSISELTEIKELINPIIEMQAKEKIKQKKR